jgi:Uma2 family endonuclease
MLPAPRVIRRHEIVPDVDGWVLTEEQVPESSPHEMLSERIKHILLGWASRAGRTVKVGRNLAVRWDRERPQIGVDPDVYVVEPPPPEGDDVLSLRLWEEGHVPPLLAVEIVSPSHPMKDYQATPLKYAACGVRELWVIDPRPEGPRSSGSLHSIQIWSRVDEDSFAQVHAGEGPAWSGAIEGWVRWVRSGAGVRSFHISSDEAGTDCWLTPQEAAERRAEAERAARDAAERRADAAEQRIRELEERLTRGGQ